jgi:hypothetical protein
MRNVLNIKRSHNKVKWGLLDTFNFVALLRHKRSAVSVLLVLENEVHVLAVQCTSTGGNSVDVHSTNKGKTMSWLGLFAENVALYNFNAFVFVRSLLTRILSDFTKWFSLYRDQLWL